MAILILTYPSSVTRSDQKKYKINDSSFDHTSHRSYQQEHFDEGMNQFNYPIHIPSKNDEYIDKDIVCASLLYNIALVNIHINEYEEALLHFSKVLSAIRVRQSILELDETFTKKENPSFQGPTIVVVLHNIAHMQLQSKKYDDAVKTFRCVLRKSSLFSTSDKMSNYEKVYNLDVSSALNCLGVALSHKAANQQNILQRGDALVEKAIDALTQSLVIREVVLGKKDSIETATILNNLGRAKFLNESLDEAKVLFEEAYRIRRSYLKESHIDIAAVLYNIGQVHYRLGNLQKTLDYYHDCLDILSNMIMTTYNPKLTGLLLEIGEIYMENERFNEALFYYNHALPDFCPGNIEEIKQHMSITSYIQNKIDDCTYRKRQSLLQKDVFVNRNKNDQLTYSSLDRCGLL